MKALTALVFIALVSTGAHAADSAVYDRHEVRFASGQFQLAGDLLVPRNADHPPVVVYVWGSGPTNRNAHIDNSPILASFIAHGFAVLLYDKPGSGGSTGEFDNRYLFAERASILLDAIRVLRARDDVDPNAVGLYGSSQASYVMAVAMARTHDIAFLIAWSCPMENSVRQGAYLLRNYVLCDGGTTEQADAAQQAYVDRACARTYPEYRAAAGVLETTPSIRDGLGWAGVDSSDAFAPADSTSESFLDPAALIVRLPFPALALYAENDRQIDPVQGATAYRRLLAAQPDDLSSVVVIPAADHNMNLSPRGCLQDQRDGYRTVGGKVLSPVFLDTVSAWLARLRAHLGTH